MKTFKIDVEVKATYYKSAEIEVEADSFEEAKHIAFDMENNDEIDFDTDPEPSFIDVFVTQIE